MSSGCAWFWADTVCRHTIFCRRLKEEDGTRLGPRAGLSIIDKEEARWQGRERERDW